MPNRTAVLFLAACTLSASAQTSTPAGSPMTTIQAGTQLVVVDVVVQDKDGHAVHGLKAEDFQLTEDKQLQQIRNFEEHTTDSTPLRGPELPKLPPGTFTDYTPVAPNGTLNILLLDALNTPMKDQSYVRYELQQYVKKADPGTRIAIFGLATHLIFLQGFTSDPETLKDVVDHKLIPRASTLLDDPVSGEADSNSFDTFDASAPGMAQLAANFTQFESEMAATQIQFRVQYTLDALNTLGHYLSAFPGRKNLIWFSGSFPINILPDGSINDPFAVTTLNEEEFRETTNLLAKSQVAVYPIDARGLMTQPMFSASNAGRGYATNPSKFGNDIMKFNNSQAAEHLTMEQMADDTGGHAYFNTNDLASAVSKAIQSGANYYTLAYTPTDRREQGAYRTIRLKLTGAGAAKNLQLSYRQGYYENDSRSHDKNAETATTTVADTSASNAATAYAHAAMSRGAPAPEDILFKVRVLPASTTTEPTVAPGNQTDPNAPPLKGPFRRMDVDLAAVSSEFSLLQQPDGKHLGSIEFLVDVYDSDGRLLNVDGRSFRLNLPPDVYKNFLKNPVQCHLEVSVPTKIETFLRIGVHDLVSNRFGVVEIPSSSVAHLAPPTYPSAPASTPSTQKPSAPVPSTPPANPSAPSTAPQR